MLLNFTILRLESTTGHFTMKIFGTVTANIAATNLAIEHCIPLGNLVKRSCLFTTCFYTVL